MENGEPSWLFQTRNQTFEKLTPITRASGAAYHSR